jgi:hypothetical protein
MMATSRIVSESTKVVLILENFDTKEVIRLSPAGPRRMVGALVGS